MPPKLFYVNPLILIDTSAKPRIFPSPTWGMGLRAGGNFEMATTSKTSDLGSGWFATLVRDEDGQPVELTIRNPDIGLRSTLGADSVRVLIDAFDGTYQAA